MEQQEPNEDGWPLVVERGGITMIDRHQATTGESLTWREIEHAAAQLAARQRGRVGMTDVYGVPTGGAPVAVMVARLLGRPLAERPGPGTLVVDDLIDTGRTLQHYLDGGFEVDALFRKPWSPPHICPHAIERNAWLRFPWEREDGAPVDAVLRLLQYIGEDPTRDGLLDTPRRVVKALTEMTAGYRDDPADILATRFGLDDVGIGGSDLVTVRRIPFSSLCEHHLLPFTGHATVSYLPGSSGVVGLSKLARLVEAFGRRLQVQERMTAQVVSALLEHGGARWAGCAIDGQHSCMAMRGIRKEATMTTVVCSSDEPLNRAELLAAHRA